jgi:hypothetical protein
MQPEISRPYVLKLGSKLERTIFMSWGKFDFTWQKFEAGFGF